MQPTKKLAWWTLSYGAGAVAALATRKALSRSWSRVAASSPPEDPADRSVPISRALIWMVAASVGMGIARLVAMRSAATAWEVATDEPPPT